MNNIDKVFEANSDGLLNIFFTAGYPQLESTVAIARALDEAGIKLIEIGLPYSDPLADGETIQESSQVALRNGMNLDILFDQVKEISEQTDLIIILMGYLNQMMSIGVEVFLKKAHKAGVSGLIIPDLPMDDYENDYREQFQKNNMAISFLITPRTSEERIRVADKLSTGFLYLVSDNSITGSDANSFSEHQKSYFQRISAMGLSTRQLIGFGIKSKEQYFEAMKYTNGAIIGSDFIRQLPAAGNEINVIVKNYINSIMHK